MTERKIQLDDELDKVILEHLSDREWRDGSSAMSERRQRIISHATIMISQTGIQNFSLRELAERSNVSLRTIFNAFQNRENVIALSMWHYFRKFDREINKGDSKATLLSSISRLMTTHLRTRHIENYRAAAIALYFSPAAKPPVRQVMQSMAGGFFLSWLEDTQSKKDIRPGLTAKRIAAEVSNIIYATIHEWYLEKWEETVFNRNLLEATLVYLIGATKGSTKAEIERFLNDIYNNGPQITAILLEAREAVSKVEAKIKA